MSILKHTCNIKWNLQYLNCWRNAILEHNVPFNMQHTLIMRTGMSTCIWLKQTQMHTIANCLANA